MTTLEKWLSKICAAIEKLNGTINSTIVTTDVTALTGAQLDALNVGDIVIKKTGKQKHLYHVSYKGEGVGEGICITYVAAGLVETVSYDLTADGWVYNSTDKWIEG